MRRIQPTRRHLVSRGTSVVVAALTVAAAQGCAAEPTSPAEEPLAAICARLDAALARFDTRASTPDDWWEAVARVVPGGFGGGFAAASTQGNTIYLVQPERFDEVRSVAARAAECPNPVRLGVLGYVASAVAVRQGRWDYIQLRRWYDQLQVAAAGVWTFAGVAGDANRLTFGVSDEQARTRLRDAAARLGIPADAVDVVIWRVGFDGRRVDG
jgi:hypothetical protein